MDTNANILEFIRFSGVPAALLLLVGVWFSAELLGRFVNQMGVRFTQWRMVIHQVGTLLRFGLYMVAILGAGALALRLSDQAVLALSGTLAVTAGFAFKDLGASVLAGITILLDRPFQVGDRVTFQGHYGEVKSIGLRSVQLVTLDDNLVTIPNNRFLTDAVSCANAGALDMMVQLDFFIGVDQDVPQARRLVIEAITSSPYVFLEKPWVVQVNQLVHERYFAVRLRAQVYVLDTRFEKTLQTDVTLRVMEAFRDHQIKPPMMLFGGADGPGGADEGEPAG